MKSKYLGYHYMYLSLVLTMYGFQLSFQLMACQNSLQWQILARTYYLRSNICVQHVKWTSYWHFKRPRRYVVWMNRYYQPCQHVGSNFMIIDLEVRDVMFHPYRPLIFSSGDGKPKNLPKNNLVDQSLINMAVVMNRWICQSVHLF
jgi:hypothetical protein